MVRFFIRTVTFRPTTSAKICSRRGVTNLNKLLYLNDVNITVGGPIKRDKLWFFAATRTAGSKNQVQGIYFNATQGTHVYTPDLDRPGYRDSSINSQAIRMTWQATSKQKISGFADIQSFQVRGVGDNKALESQTRWNFWPINAAAGNLDLRAPADCYWKRAGRAPFSRSPAISRRRPTTSGSR